MAAETCPAMLMITSSPAPDSESSVTSVYRLSCHRSQDLRKAPALTEMRRLEVLVGFLVVGEDALLAVPLQLAFEIERHNAQQHSLGERRGESEVRHGSRNAPLAGHDPLRVVPWRAPQDLGRQLSIPHPRRRQQGDAAFGSFTASRQIALVADKNDALVLAAIGTACARPADTAASASSHRLSACRCRATRNTGPSPPPPAAPPPLCPPARSRAPRNTGPPGPASSPCASARGSAPIRSRLP